jgi:hypothetical protein
MTEIEERSDIIYLIFERRYADDQFSASWITKYIPWFNGWITIWIQLFFLLPPLLYLSILELSGFSLEMFAPFTNWTVFFSTTYILASIWANIFSFLPYFDLKWLAVTLSSIALNVTLIASVTSWTIIHPFILFELDFANTANLIQ